MFKHFYQHRFQKECRFLIKQWSRVLKTLTPFLVILIGAAGYFYQKEYDQLTVHPKIVEGVMILLASGVLYFGQLRTQMEQADEYYQATQQSAIKAQFPLMIGHSLLLRLPVYLLASAGLAAIVAPTSSSFVASVIKYLGVFFLGQTIDYCWQLLAFMQNSLQIYYLRFPFFLMLWGMVIIFPKSLGLSFILIAGIGLLLYNIRSRSTLLILDQMVTAESERKNRQRLFFSWFDSRVQTPSKAEINQPDHLWEVPLLEEDTAVGYYLKHTLFRDREIMQLMRVWVVLLTTMMVAFPFTVFSAIFVAGASLLLAMLFQQIVQAKHKELPFFARKTTKPLQLQLLVFLLCSLVLIMSTIVMMIFHGWRGSIYLTGILPAMLYLFVKGER